MRVLSKLMTMVYLFYLFWDNIYIICCIVSTHPLAYPLLLVVFIELSFVNILYWSFFTVYKGHIWIFVSCKRGATVHELFNHTLYVMLREKERGKKREKKRLNPWPSVSMQLIVLLSYLSTHQSGSNALG
jgi:hypothetical protein